MNCSLAAFDHRLDSLLTPSWCSIFIPVGQNQDCTSPHLGVPVIFRGAGLDELAMARIVTNIKFGNAKQARPLERFVPYTVDVAAQHGDEGKVVLTPQTVLRTLSTDPPAGS